LAPAQHARRVTVHDRLPVCGAVGVWHLPVATTIIIFVLEYAWPGRWLTRRNLTLLAITSLLTLGLILTNELHHLA